MVLLYVPCPDMQKAQEIARSLLEKRLVACANFIPHMSSLYWWENKIESSSEVLLLLKCADDAHCDLIEEKITAMHPYKTPAILKFSPACNAPFQEWLEDQTK